MASSCGHILPQPVDTHWHTLPLSVWLIRGRQASVLPKGHPRANSHTHCLSHICKDSRHTQTQSQTPPLTCTHAHSASSSHILSYFYTLSHFLPLSSPHTFTYTRTHLYTHTLSHTHTQVSKFSRVFSHGRIWKYDPGGYPPDREPLGPTANHRRLASPQSGVSGAASSPHSSVSLDTLFLLVAARFAPLRSGRHNPYVPELF